jgi:DNA-binding CsgD family transcriptional regulator
METLSHKDLLALNRAIGEVHSARDKDSFYRSVFSAVQGMIPGELCSFNEMMFKPTRFLNSIASSDEHINFTNRFLPALNAHLHEHPCSPHIITEKVIKTSDYVSKRHFKNTALFNEYYKHLDIETQINLAFPLSQEKSLVFTLSKRSTDFSERDRFLLTLLRPHLINALRNATELGFMKLEKDLLQKGAEAEKQGAILFQADGVMLCLSLFAKEMLKKYFDATLVEGDTLPRKLLTWFKTKESSKRVERELLTIEKDDKCLKIKLLNDFTTGDYILIITERDPSLALQNLQGYGLSCREAEVLIWLSKGKTNVEIAIILGMSKRTAEKHLQNIFAKLGVETRAAAAAMIQ